MELSFEVNNTPSEVFRYLSDMEAFVSVHQLIYRIDPIADGSYLIHEKLKIGPIPYRFTYPVMIHADAKKGEVKMLAVIKKLIFVEMDFIILPSDGKTIVKEVVSIKSVLPVKPILKVVFAREHKKMFAKME
ncbi:MAG: SRPBCC family protein [Bacteroidia bacterium]